MLGQLLDLWRGSVDLYRWLETDLTEWMVGEGAWMDKEKAPVCPVGSEQHTALTKRGKPTGHRLCEGHFDQLDKTLRAIEEEFGDLDPVPSIAIHLNTGGGGHSGGGLPAHEQAPARLDALVLTDPRRGRGDSEFTNEEQRAGRTQSALVVLSFFAERVRTERVLGYPAETFVDCLERTGGTRPHGPTYGLPCWHPRCSGVLTTRTIPIPPTVRSERQVLSRHLDWIVRWPDVEDFYAAMRRLLTQLRRANGTAVVPVGHCPVDAADGQRCGGPLWPVRPKHTAGEDAWTGSAPSAVSCNECDARWEGPGELARLALLLEDKKGVSA